MNRVRHLLLIYQIVTRLSPSWPCRAAGLPSPGYPLDHPAVSHNPQDREGRQERRRDQYQRPVRFPHTESKVSVPSPFSARIPWIPGPSRDGLYCGLSLRILASAAGHTSETWPTGFRFSGRAPCSPGCARSPERRSGSGEKAASHTRRRRPREKEAPYG